MIKIFLTVRNRLAITQKCIRALKLHSKIPHQIYVYNNNTNHLLDQHFAYFYKLFENNVISQVTFTKNEATFNAFSKASTCNFWGNQHEMDPKKSTYDYLVMLDNDIIVTPEWDVKLKLAWKHVNKNNLTNIKVIGQRPGGIKGITQKIKITKEIVGKVGKLGGSGLWSVRPNFFTDVGFLNLKQLVGHDKRHDQLYWSLMERATSGQPYIMGLNQKLGIHCGKEAGSVCNKLTRNRNNKNKEETIKFADAEKKIASMDFDDFFNQICNNRNLTNDW